MISSLIEFLAGIVIDIISALGYAGVFLAMAIESACIPLPSEIIMPFSGYLVFTDVFAYVGDNTPVNLLLVGAVGASQPGLPLLAYWVGAKGGRPLVENTASMYFCLIMTSIGGPMVRKIRPAWHGFHQDAAGHQDFHLLPCRDQRHEALDFQPLYLSGGAAVVYRPGLRGL